MDSPLTKLKKKLKDLIDQDKAAPGIQFVPQPIKQGVNTVLNTKFLPGQKQTASQVLSKPQNLFLPSALSNMPKSNPISVIGRPVGQANRGYLDSNTMSLVRTPGSNPETLSEKIAYGVGYAGGFINPYNLATKAFGGLAAIGRIPTTAVATRIVPKAVQTATPQLLKTGGKVLAEEVAQSAGYIGAKSLLGKKDDFKTDLLMGLGVRGAFGGAGRFVGQAMSNPTLARQQDAYELDRAVEVLRNKTKHGQNAVSEALKIIDSLSDKNLGRKVIDNLKGTPNKRVSQRIKLLQKVFSDVDPLPGGMQYRIPGMGIVGDQPSGKQTIEQLAEQKAGFKIPGLRKRFDEALLKGDRTEVEKLLPDVPVAYRQRLGDQIDKVIGSSTKPPMSSSFVGNKEPLPWETTRTSSKGISEVQRPIISKTQLPEPQGVKIAGVQPQKTRTVQPESRVPNRTNPIDPQLEDIVKNSGSNVKQKVGLLDYLRTPDRVLEKIGLGKQAKALRTSYEAYKKQLPVEIDKITQWSRQVSPESNQRIFQYLDGKPVQLTQGEQRVANEIKVYLSEWADKLQLPKEGRITNYITHIFEKDFIQKEFDPDLAKLIQDQVAGSVYDPFVQQRLGKRGYVEDTWRALDAYVKRATRKVNLDSALQHIKEASEGLEQSQYNYVKSYIDRVNMRPTNLDNLLDNTIKQVVGYKFGQRPTTVLTQKMRQAVYRGTLGLNFGSALRNLSQGSNTYARLGEKYTTLGYIKMLTNWNSDELTKTGILSDDMIQDRTLSATKKFWEKMDKGLFVFFNAAEKINRGAAYYGAKSKAISQGMSEEQAIEFAKKVVRDTQFTFGSIDTPQVLQSDLAKSLLQFQSYNIKQMEFLGEMFKNKDVAGLSRYAGASAFMMFTIGKLIGMKPQDFVPLWGVMTGETKVGETPPVQLGKEMIGAVTNSKGEYGEELTPMDRAERIGNKLVPFFPAGTQIKKTIQGIDTIRKGYSESKSGRVQYVVPQDPITAVRAAVFGKSNLDQARDYFDNDKSVMGESQSEMIKQSSDKLNLFDMFTKQREQNAEIETTKEQLSNVKNGTAVVGGKVLYYDAEAESVKSIDISKFSKEPGGAVEKARWNQEKFDTAFKIYSAEGIDDKQKQELISKLGEDSTDLAYYDIAKDDPVVRRVFVEEYLHSLPSKETRLASLSDLRRSVKDKRILTDTLINDLVDEGLLSESEGKYLKSIQYDEKAKTFSQKKKSGRKISLSVPKMQGIRIQAPPKMQQIKFSQSRAPQLKLVSTRRQTPKVKMPNLEAPKMRIDSTYFQGL